MSSPPRREYPSPCAPGHETHLGFSGQTRKPCSGAGGPAVLSDNRMWHPSTEGSENRHMALGRVHSYIPWPGFQCSGLGPREQLASGESTGPGVRTPGLLTNPPSAPAHLSVLSHLDYLNSVLIAPQLPLSPPCSHTTQPPGWFFKGTNLVLLLPFYSPQWLPSTLGINSSLLTWLSEPYVRPTTQALFFHIPLPLLYSHWTSLSF